MLSIRSAASTQDLENILALQGENMRAGLSAEEIKEQGFITVRHSLEQLQAMQERVPQILAVDGDRLGGFALVMPRELKNSIPVLVPMFEMLDNLHYQGTAVKDLRYYVMGQICVGKDYRGQGVFRQLYQAHREQLSQDFDYCITEVSTSNIRSMRAHQKIGFQVLHTFTDELDEWNIVLWDWTK